MVFQRLIAASALAVLLTAPRLGRADVEEPVTLEAGDFAATVAAGGVALDRDWTWGMQVSARFGLPLRLELAFPLAVAVRLYSTDAGSGLVLAGGVVDTWVAGDGAFLWSPAAAVAARIRVAATSTALAAIDLTGAEEGFAAADHPWWLRSSLALVIDMGPYLSIAGGLAYQRHLWGGFGPEEARRAGWVGRDARISLGAVRARPFEDLPTVAVHVTRWLDIVAFVRVDMDTDTDTVDARYMGGLRVISR